VSRRNSRLRGALAGPDRSPEFGQGAPVGGIVAQDGGDVTQPRIGRRGQVVLPGGRGRKPAQGDAVQVGAVVRAERVVFRERDDDLAQQLADDKYSRLGCVEGADVGRERERQHMGAAVGAVGVRHPGGEPHRPARRYHPRPAAGAHVQDARAGVDELVLRVVVPVDAFAVLQAPIRRAGKRMAVHRHHQSV
jgi:hypothetical protein